MLNILLFDAELIWQDFKSIDIFARSPCLAGRENIEKNRISAANQITAEKAGGGRWPMG
jgi:hypothetical protein